VVASQNLHEDNTVDGWFGAEKTTASRKALEILGSYQPLKSTVDNWNIDQR